MKSLLKRSWAFLIEDIGAKIFIVGFSAFLWYFVNVLALDKTSISLPVELDNSPEGAAVVPIDRLNVQVDLRSRQDLTERLSGIRAYLDLSQARKGESFYRVRLQGVPEGVFSSVLPYTLRIDIDEAAEKRVPIVLRTKGADGKNYLLDYRFDPDKITVRGPSRQLRRLKEVESEILDLKTVNSTQSILPLGLINPPYCRIEETNAQVSVHLAMEIFTNVVDIPLVFENIPEGKIIRDAAVSVLLISRFSNKNILKTRTKAFANASAVSRTGKVKMPVRLESEDIILSNLNPEAEADVFE